MLITLYSLVVLMDLGLDPASPQARKMIDRVEKRMVFKRLNNRPFLDGETEPCINARILAIGAYFKKPNDALANQLLERATRRWRLELRSTQEPAVFVPHHHLRARRTARIRTSGAQIGAPVTKASREKAENYLLERRMFRSLRTGEVINKRWLRFSFPTFWHYDVLRGLDYLRNAGIKPDNRVRDAIEIVIKRRHQNGRWPLNRLHPEYIPLQMETDIGSASRWNYTARSPRPALVQQLSLEVMRGCPTLLRVFCEEGGRRWPIQAGVWLERRQFHH